MRKIQNKTVLAEILSADPIRWNPGDPFTFYERIPRRGPTERITTYNCSVLRHNNAQVEGNTGTKPVTGNTRRNLTVLLDNAKAVLRTFDRYTTFEFCQSSFI